MRDWSLTPSRGLARLTDTVMVARSLPLLIEFTASIFGLASNCLAQVIASRIRISLCTFLVVSNIIVILTKLAWLFHPESRRPHELSLQAKVFGEITVILWFFNMKVHVVISIDRFYSIALPSVDKKRNNAKIIGAITFSAAFFQTSLMHLYPGAYFAYDYADHSWNYRGTEWAETYAIFLDFYVCCFEMFLVCIIDCVTLSKLRDFARKNSNISDQQKQIERRLLVQSMLQSLPYMGLLVVYFEIAPFLETPFFNFPCDDALLANSNSIGWVIVTIKVLNGPKYFFRLFIVIFHFKKLIRQDSSVADSAAARNV